MALGQGAILSPKNAFIKRSPPFYFRNFGEIYQFKKNWVFYKFSVKNRSEWSIFDFFKEFLEIRGKLDGLIEKTRFFEQTRQFYRFFQNGYEKTRVF